jgi:hypothetical protein
VYVRIKLNVNGRVEIGYIFNHCMHGSEMQVVIGHIAFINIKNCKTLLKKLL